MPPPCPPPPPLKSSRLDSAALRGRRARGARKASLAPASSLCSQTRRMEGMKNLAWVTGFFARIRSISSALSTVAHSRVQSRTEVRAQATLPV